ncbi:hypothetical protein [Alienimonas sp. DA493]|uniref:hypothetical protein n=1 Tax=Alienimonas sp. DA493 TaxID=3373605 RepID=UPI003754C407
MTAATGPPLPDDSLVASALRRLINDRFGGQSAAVRELGIAQGTLSAAMLGKHLPSAKLLQALAAVGCDVTALLRGGRPLGDRVHGPLGTALFELECTVDRLMEQSRGVEDWRPLRRELKRKAISSRKEFERLAAAGKLPDEWPAEVRAGLLLNEFRIYLDFLEAEASLNAHAPTPARAPARDLELPPPRGGIVPLFNEFLPGPPLTFSGRAVGAVALPEQWVRDGAYAVWTGLPVGGDPEGDGSGARILTSDPLNDSGLDDCTVLVWTGKVPRWIAGPPVAHSGTAVTRRTVLRGDQSFECVLPPIVQTEYGPALSQAHRSRSASKGSWETGGPKYARPTDRFAEGDRGRRLRVLGYAAYVMGPI